MTAPPIEISARACRAAEITEAIAPDDGEAPFEVTVSFSSEAPYRRHRWNAETERVEPYFEVLGHGDGEVDLSRLTDGAPVLKDHSNRIDDQVGTVRAAWIEGGRGYAKLRLGRSAAARDLAERIGAGEIRNVSVGYDIDAAVAAGEADGIRILRVTRWTPSEISFVPVPADQSVGLGRADQPAAVLVAIPDTETPPLAEKEALTMTTKTKAAEAAPEATTETRAAQPVDREALAREIRAAEVTRAAEIEATGEALGLPADMVRKAKADGVSVEDFNAQAIRHMASPQATAARASRAQIGMEEKDKDRFSFGRLIRALADPTNATAASEAGFELEVCRAAAKGRGSRNADLTIPHDVLTDPAFMARGTRAAGAASMTTGVAADGGALVPTEHRGGSFIDMLTNDLSIMAAGATMLSGLMGDVDIPKQTGRSGASWVTEGGDATGTKPAVGTVALVPHTLAAEVEFTRRMRIQADPSVEAFLRRDIVRSMALELDATALNGSTDAGAPSGLADLVAADTWATASTITRNELIDMKSAVRSANVTGAPNWIANSITVGELEKTPLDAGSGRFLLDDGKLINFPVLESNQAEDFDLTLGDFAHFLVGLWSGLDIRVDPYTRAGSDGVIIRCFQDADFQVRHAGAFVRRANG